MNCLGCYKKIEKKEYFYDKNTSKYTKGKNIYGVWEVILKNKKINDYFIIALFKIEYIIGCGSISASNHECFC